jgi:hypothetical protein
MNADKISGSAADKAEHCTAVLTLSAFICGCVTLCVSRLVILAHLTWFAIVSARYVLWRD